MKGKWWKALGVAIFVYVLVGGLLVPLKPGILSVQPGIVESGDTTILEVSGYNTHFKSGSIMQAWLKLDSAHFTKATGIDAMDETSAKMRFLVPAGGADSSKLHPLTLVITSETDGSFVQPGALVLRYKKEAGDTQPWDMSLNEPMHEISALRFPYRNILHETIRNTFFHIALWFAMFLLLLAGLWYAIRYLRQGHPDDDIKSAAYHQVAILFGILGIATGSIWAKYTWNTFWTTDVKLNMTAVAMLIYLAYLILRNAIADADKRAKTSAGYSIFAFIALIPLVFVIPRLTDSLHPGNGGNPALGGEDLDYTLRLFFYPSIIALTLLGNWMATLVIRYERLKEKILSQE